MKNIDFGDVIEAMQGDDLERILSNLKGGGISKSLLKGKNETRYSNWFSGKGATLLQLTAFLRPALAPALLEIGAEMDLHSACALGDTDEIGKFLASDPGALDEQIDTYHPIQYAIRNSDALRYLLEHGDDANRPIQKMAWYDWEDQAAERGLSDWRLIHMVALVGHDVKSIETAEILNEFGADLNAFSSPFGETPLHIAAIYDGHLLIRWLVEHGVDVDVGTVDKGQTSATTDLFDSSAFALFDSYAQTPLMLALGEGMSQAVEALLDVGADANARDSAGFTPLYYAAGAFWKENVGHVKLLLKHGASLSSTDARGRRPIDLARCKKYQETVELLENGDQGNPLRTPGSQTTD